MDNNNLLSGLEAPPRRDAALDLLIEAALNAYPLAPPPPGFTARVMAEVWQAPRLAFRLEFIDLALPAFFALFGAGTLAVMMFVLFSLTQLTRMQLDLQAKIILAQVLILQQQTVIIWMPLLAICALLLLAGMIGLGIWATQRPLLLSD